MNEAAHGESGRNSAKCIAIFSHSPAKCPGAHKEVFDLIGSQIAGPEDLSKQMGVSDTQIHVLLAGHTASW